VLGLAIAFGTALPPAASANDSADAAAHASTAGWLDEIALSSELGGEPIATGSLQTADGTNFDAGLPVVLWGWPSHDVLEAMSDGDTVKLTPLGKALTDENGEFEIRVEDAAAAERLADDDGGVSLEIQAWSPEGQASYSFTSELVDDELASTDATDIVAHEAESASEAPSDIQSVFDKTDICGATKLVTYRDVDTVVGRMYAKTSGISSYFSLKNGADTKLGVASSANGKYGSFSQSGTSTISIEDTFTWGKKSLTAGRQFVTDFTYAKFSNWCYPVGTGLSSDDVYSYSVRPISWDGGGTYAAATIPSVGTGNCRPFGDGTYQERKTTTATTASSGVKISSIVGIDLTSQVGYSSDAVARIYNDSGVQKRICGTNGVPTSPGRFLAQA
jgi:hypothetical protein